MKSEHFIRLKSLRIAGWLKIKHVFFHHQEHFNTIFRAVIGVEFRLKWTILNERDAHTLKHIHTI